MSDGKGIEQRGGVTHNAIHFSATFPVVTTACGVKAPSAALWRFVDCEACLEAGPDDPRIRARLAHRCAPTGRRRPRCDRRNLCLAAPMSAACHTNSTKTSART